MIMVNGSIAVRTIHGRHGPFNVGVLRTEIGDFSVKDQCLEELAEGKYDARCTISHIKPNHYVAGARLVVEIRAFLDSIELLQDEAEDVDVQDLVVEPDPIEEVAVPAPVVEETAVPAVEVAPATETSEVSIDSEASGDGAAATVETEAPEAEQSAQAVAEATDEADPEDDSLQELFGHLWPIGSSIELDPTVDRAQFRAQIGHLKQSGYRYKASDKVWELSQV